MQKIIKGDEVILIAGKDKGRIGKVIHVLRNRMCLIIEGLNIVKKHVKPNPQIQQQGGIVEVEAPVHKSNVAIYNPVTRKADQVCVKVMEDNKKARYFKSNDEPIDIN